MSSKRRRGRSTNKQAQIQPDVEKRIITHSDSIERIVDELLAHDKSNNEGQIAASSSTSSCQQGSSSNQEEQRIFDIDLDDVNCEQCRVYFPMLKNFMMHIESSHEGKVSDDGVTYFGCESCKMGFDNPVTLAMHSLLHFCRKAPGKDTDILTPANVSQESGQHTGSDIQAENVPTSSECNQTAARAFTRIFEHISSNNGNELENDVKVSSEAGGGTAEKIAITDLSNSANAIMESVTKQGRDKLPTSHKSQAEHFREPISPLQQPREVSDESQHVDKALIDISCLLPSLRKREDAIGDKSNDVINVNNIIRPRECTPSFGPASSVLGAAESTSVTTGHVEGEDSPVPKEAFGASTEQLDERGEGADKDQSHSASQLRSIDSDLIKDEEFSSVPENVQSPDELAEKKRRNADNQCIICLEKFATKELLKIHRRDSHGDRTKWICPDCSREFNSHWKYRDHCAKVHSNKKPFKCSECGKCLSSFTILATHEGLHSGARPHECDICGKRYLVAAGLKDHLIAHKNEREHRCVVCGAGFNAKGDLKKHMVTHWAEKPHRCHVCDTGFNRSASLQRHMRTHTGEKPFKCDLCQKAFSRREKMLEHRRTHTGERPLVCTICGKSFKDSSNFSNHKKIHQSGYIPRKRKRSMVKESNINSVIIPPDEPVVPAVVTGMGLASTITSIVTGKPASLQGKDSALKDLATISTTMEDLQSANQEWLRQLLGAALDQSDIRNLVNVQTAVTLPGNALNLSADDVRSLQIIINGMQGRNTAVSDENTTQTTQ